MRVGFRSQLLEESRTEGQPVRCAGAAAAAAPSHQDRHRQTSSGPCRRSTIQRRKQGCLTRVFTLSQQQQRWEGAAQGCSNRSAGELCFAAHSCVPQLPLPTAPSLTRGAAAAQGSKHKCSPVQPPPLAGPATGPPPLPPGCCARPSMPGWLVGCRFGRGRRAAKARLGARHRPTPPGFAAAAAPASRQCTAERVWRGRW